MNFLTSFLKTIQASIYSPKFYSQLKKSPFQSSFNYFLILAFFLSFIQVIFLAYPLITQTPKQLNFFANAIVGSYPKDLEINIQNGQVKINQPEPYFIHFSKEIPKPNLTDLENLVVIDTKTPFTSQQFNDYHATLWLAKDLLFYKDSKTSQIKTLDFSKISQFKLNKLVIDDFLAKIRPWFSLVGVVLLILISIGLYLFYLLRLVQLLAVAFLIWLLAKAFKHALKYKQAYIISLHAITLSLIVELILMLVRGFSGYIGFPFMFTIITLLVVAINLFLDKTAKS